MQFSELWLRSFVSPALDSDQLGHLLTMAGLEVEEQDGVAAVFSKVVVAQIVEAEKHPNADKLRVCKVDAGQGELLPIVCGAPNAAAGMKIPCALVGADLAGFGIKATKLRSVESFGMLFFPATITIEDPTEELFAIVGMTLKDCPSFINAATRLRILKNATMDRP